MRRAAVAMVLLAACSAKASSSITPSSTSPTVTLDQAKASWCVDSDQLRLVASALPAFPPDTQTAARVYKASHAITADAALYDQAGDPFTAATLTKLAAHVHALGDALSISTDPAA